MPNTTAAGTFYEEGTEPPGYVDPRLMVACPACGGTGQVLRAAEPEPEPAEAGEPEAEAAPDPAGEPAFGAALGVVIPMPAEEPAAETGGAEPDAEPESAAEDAASEVKAPPVRASRADWAAHAIEVHGASQAEVDEMTKQQLIDAYGSAPGE